MDVSFLMPPESLHFDLQFTHTLHKTSTEGQICQLPPIYFFLHLSSKSAFKTKNKEYQGILYIKHRQNTRQNIGPHPVEGLIPVVPPNISNDHNQHTRIKQPYNCHHTYSKNTHVHI